VRLKTLLQDLPRQLRAYGKTYDGYGGAYKAVMFVVCDLDDRCLKEFREQLLGMLDACNPRPDTRFCIAIEECEAWLLGDIPAVKTAFPKAKETVIQDYKNDSICGTWELFANAVFKGGAALLKKKGWQAVGMEKSRWAESITPYMDVEKNESPSFRYFRDILWECTR
jgi:hypothetical protein